MGGAPSREAAFEITTPRASYIPDINEPPEVGRGAEGSPTVSKLDKRSWLEVVDPKHRYAKHLRWYYQAWDLLGSPTGHFFTWLDSTSYELDRCPRATLEADRVHYCPPAEAETFALRIVDGVARWVSSGELLTTGPEGFIFVLRRGVVYAAPKRTEPPRFHHSSFFAGGACEVAGVVVAQGGAVTRIFPHSGHYRPGNEHIQHLLRWLASRGVELGGIEVDGQHTMKVARLLAKEGSRLKKKERPHFLNGETILSFLEMKAWSTPLFEELLRRGAQAAEFDRRKAAAAAAAEDVGKRRSFGFVGRSRGAAEVEPVSPQESTDEEATKDEVLAEMAKACATFGSLSPPTVAWSLRGMELRRTSSLEGLDLAKPDLGRARTSSASSPIPKNYVLEDGPHAGN